MVESSEMLYTDTKLYKQGKKKLSLNDQKLATWINERFNVNVINILLDKINDNTPRLNIIFEYQYEENQMLDEHNLNFDINYQKEISERFVQISGSHKSAEYIFVCYHSFSPIAIEEANQRIPTDKIIYLKDKYLKYNVWEIYRVFGSVTIFFNTDNQVIENKESEINKQIRIDYFNLIKEYDEFDYITIETLDVSFDSKQNLDKNYEGSFFYFFR